MFYNPYFDQTFFGFLKVLFFRVISGEILNPVSDEIQLIVLLGLSISASLTGSFLILKKMTMLANSLSHTILIGIAAAFYFLMQGDSHFQLNIAPLLASAVVMGFVTVLLTEWLTNYVKLQEDAATGLVFTSLFALGIIFVTVLTRSSHISTEVVMGNVDALHIDDVKLIFYILACNAVIFGLFFKEFKITTFDPVFAKFMGISTTFFGYLLMIQASLTVIGSFRAVGVIMILCYMTAPVLAARFLTNTLGSLILYSIFLGSLASLIGVAMSRYILTVTGNPLSTAGLTIAAMATIFTIHLAIYRKRARSSAPLDII